MSLPFIKHHFANGVKQKQPPPTEVVPKAKRRQFSAPYKLRILEEYERCNKPGERGALLRREGLYSSTLTTWRRQRDQGQIGARSPKKRGPKPAPDAAVPAIVAFGSVPSPGAAQSPGGVKPRRMPPEAQNRKRKKRRKK